MAIADDVRKSVVFFGKQVPSRAAADGVEIAYGGTGFLVAYEEDGLTFRYLVTCRHVAEQLDVDFFLRLNTVNGDAEALPIQEADWQYHTDDAVDIAATDIGLNALHFDHLAVQLSKKSTRDATACGQRIHIVGLFRLHYGQKRNVPIVHTGHIAALPDPGEKIPIKNRSSGRIVMAESYLVEAQTLELLSGSPVFVQEYISWKAAERRGDDISEVTIGAFGQVKLLGVYQGAWDACHARY